jgi:hypothetical protein
MSDPRQKSSAERVLDLTVYGPLGLAITIAESFPQLVRKGRSVIGPQVGVARTVGQFAVRQGYRQLRDLKVPRPPFPFRSESRTGPAEGDAAGPGAGNDPVRPPSASPRDGTGDTSRSAPTARSRPWPRPPGQPTAVGRDHVEAAELAIPSYDSLSASQVVQRLAGLSRDEVEAVQSYEAATRGRRTILARAEQLLG